MLAPTIGQPACQEQLIEAAKLVAKSVEGIVSAAQSACNDDHILQDLGGAATAVTRALNDLLQHIKKAAGPTKVIAVTTRSESPKHSSKKQLYMYVAGLAMFFCSRGIDFHEPQHLQGLVRIRASWVLSALLQRIEKTAGPPKAVESASP